MLIDVCVCFVTVRTAFVSSSMNAAVGLVSGGPNGKFLASHWACISSSIFFQSPELDSHGARLLTSLCPISGKDLGVTVAFILGHG